MRSSVPAQSGKAPRATQRNIRRELLTILNDISDATTTAAEVGEPPASPASASTIHAGMLEGHLAGEGSAEQRVYAAVRNAIAEHRLGPGTKLKEVALAQLFRVSRATIRIVLARLSHEGLVDVHLNRGASIAAPSAAEAREIFEARHAIEGCLAAKAARLAGPEDVAKLRALIAAQQTAHERDDERDAQRLSIDFHRGLAMIGGNGVLARYLDELVLRTPLIALAHRGDAPAICGAAAHSALVDAIAQHDDALAATLMQQHVDQLRHELTRERAAPGKTLAEIFGRAAP